MLLIWFNSAEHIYEVGTKGDFDAVIEYNGTAFDILHEFNSYSLGIAKKVAKSLNAARLESIKI